MGKPGSQKYTAHPMPPHCCAMTHAGSPDPSLRVNPGPPKVPGQLPFAEAASPQCALKPCPHLSPGLTPASTGSGWWVKAMRGEVP